MAVHEVCLAGVKIPDVDDLMVNTVIYLRCEMIYMGRCTGNGEISNAAFQYCDDCSECYNICEICGRSFTSEHPKLIISCPNTAGVSPWMKGKPGAPLASGAKEIT
jgi:hypothetical protein